MRKRYFARSDGASFAQPSSKAPRAARDREIDVLRAGERDLEQRLLGRGRDRLEPLARPRLDLLAADEEPVALLISTMSRASGAGAYSHSRGAGTAAERFSTWAISRS